MAKRNRIVAIRLSEEEFAHLKEQAANCTLRMEPMLRNMIAGVELRTRPCEHHPALLNALTDISNDTHAILTALRSKGQLGTVDISRLQQRMDDCWRHIREY